LFCINDKHDYILKHISYILLYFLYTQLTESPPCKKKALDVLFGDSFTQRERKSTSETARAEVTRYRVKDVLPLTENAMKWWRSQEKELSVLSTLAKWCLCIPGTSVPAERVYSL